MTDYLLGVDIGTGGCKATLIGLEGNLIATASRDYPTSYPRPGWSEQNPADWWRASVEAIRHVLADSGISPRAIQAIGVDGPAHNAVLLDEDGNVVRPVIIWTDQRTAEEVAWLEERYGQRIFEIGYQWVNPTWTLPQLLWVRRHDPKAWGQVRRIMITKDYVRSRLTGDWVTDRIDALSTLFFDARAVRWSEELCSYIDLPMEWLPPVVNPTDVVGEVTPMAAEETGLAPGTPVVAGTSDSAAEDFGAGAVRPGQCIVKLATAANLNVMTSVARPHPKTLTYYHVVPGMWYTCTATNSCASAHRWFRDTFCQEEIRLAQKSGRNAYELMGEMAAEIPVGCEGLLFHPYLLGERSPYWDPHLRADFVGITMRHTRAHFARAILEGIAFSIRDCRGAIDELELPIDEVRIIGGGARSALWRAIVCDVLGVPVLKPALDDASFGAALLAGIGVGIYADPMEATDRCVRIAARHEPDPKNHKRYSELFDIYKSVQAHLADDSHRLHRFAQHTE